MAFSVVIISIIAEWNYLMACKIISKRSIDASDGVFSGDHIDDCRMKLPNSS